MKRTIAALVVCCSLFALASCAKRTVAGRWRLDREHTTMPMGFNLKGESYLEIKLNGDGIDLRDSVSTFETGNATLMDRHYTLDGQEHVAESDGGSTLYISARLEGYTLYTHERIVKQGAEGERPTEEVTSVTYVVSASGMHLTGTDETGKTVAYDRQ